MNDIFQLEISVKEASKLLAIRLKKSLQAQEVWPWGALGPGGGPAGRGVGCPPAAVIRPSPSPETASGLEPAGFTIREDAHQATPRAIGA